MTTSLTDLIENCGALPANSIPFYDGCDWKFVQLPENGLNTCEDVLTCITSQFIASLLSSSDNSITIGVNGSLTVNPLILQSLINVQLVGTDLTVWGTTVDLASILTWWAFTINDGTNSTTINLSDVLNIVGLDWLRFFVSANDQISIGLPTNRQNGQVLTWNETTWEAEWQNNQCCAQTLELDCERKVLSISGWNSIDLSCIDNQSLSFDPESGNITITGGNTINISAINTDEQELSWTQDAGNWYITITNGNTITIPKPAIMNCQDVEDCMQPVIDNINQVFNAQVTSLQNQITSLQAQITTLAAQL